MWLDDGDKESSPEDGQASIYTEALNGAIEDILARYSDIDENRIYIAGCSNGGFMTLKLAEVYGDKFAAYAPICEAYYNKYLSDEKINALKALNIWFIHSEDDPTVAVNSFTVPTYTV